MQYYDNYVNQKRRRPNLNGPRRQTEASETVDMTAVKTAPIAHHGQASDSHKMVPAADTSRERWKLAGVYAVIALCATIMAWVLGFDLQIWLEWFMGGFLIIFGSFKLIGYEDFMQMFPAYDPIGSKSRWYTMAYPFIELFLGFLYVANLLPIPRDLVTLAIFSISGWGLLKYINSTRSQAIQCACLGNIIKLPLSTVSLIEDVLMAGMSVIMLISHFIF